LRTDAWHTRRGYNLAMEQTASFRVPGMHCAHCERAVRDEVGAVSGVESVQVDLETKLVIVKGESLDDAVLRAAIEEAGYEAA
jgi:copper chaperone